MGSSFEVIGGHQLSGVLKPQGAKNEALQVLCAVLLTEDEVTIHNIPFIQDIKILINILQQLGVVITHLKEGSYTFKSKDIDIDYLYQDEFIYHGGLIRGSVMLAGPILGRFKKTYIAKPGGDNIGRRRLDTHLLAFQQLGASIQYDDNKKGYVIDGAKLKGDYILLEEPSVTGTANLIMSAVLIPGKTTLYNAACEPYIQQLCKLLQAMGAHIQGVGSNLLIIKGVATLHGASHRLLPDMIEVGSFIGLAALTQSNITIQNVEIAHLTMMINKFMLLGIDIQVHEDNIHIPCQDVYTIRKHYDGSILTLYDHPWPGLSPDLMSIFLVVAIQARGSVLIHQKMFESRLFFVDKLIDMGAQIILCDPHRVVVIGLERKKALKGIEMSSPDIRAGQALLIAALSAKGTSVIQNIEQIDRGYQCIDQRLNAIGAKIKRISK